MGVSPRESEFEETNCIYKYIYIHIYIYLHLVSSNSDSLGETPSPNFGFFRILGPNLIYNRGLDIASDLEYILAAAAIAVGLGSEVAAIQAPPPHPGCNSGGGCQSQ